MRVECEATSYNLTTSVHKTTDLILKPTERFQLIDIHT